MIYAIDQMVVVVREHYKNTKLGVTGLVSRVESFSNILTGDKQWITVELDNGGEVSMGERLADYIFEKVGMAKV